METVKIYVSPSDQEYNLYAVGDTNERDQCLRIGEALEAALNRMPGIEARCSRTGSTFEAVRESNAWGADYHISCHTNAFDGTVAGTRIFYYPGNDRGRGMAESILARLSPITPGISDNVSAAAWSEMGSCTATNVYVEAAFHDNPEEAAWIISHTEDIGLAIAEGIRDYLGLTAPEDKKPRLYRVQVGAFRVKENAQGLLEKLSMDYPDAFIVEVAE